MEKNFKWVTASLFFVVLLFGTSGQVKATDCTSVLSGNLTISSSCAFPNLIDGIDSGTGATNIGILTISAGTLTVSASQTLALGSIQFSGGNLVLINTGRLFINAPLYMKDADADGWPDSLTLATTSATTGYVRRASLSGLTLDCDTGSSYNTSNVCCSANGSACGADSTCCTSICGTDADSDGYFSLAIGHSGTCQATAKPYTDCYDSNANANPAQASYFTSSRGDGSFDYNCNGSQESNTGSYTSCSCGNNGCSYTNTSYACSSYSPPGCGGSYSWTSPDESHSGGTCYAQACPYGISGGGTVGCR